MAVSAAWPYGIDISNWQGTIDWDAVATGGIGFAFAKTSEGLDYLDPTFERNWAEMKRVGLVRGAYHFARPDGSGPEDQAAFFVSSVLGHGGLMTGDLLVLDLEAGSGNLADWAQRFGEAVRSLTGAAPLVYTNQDFINTHGLGAPALASYPLWLAAWSAQMPEPPGSWSYIAVWQYTDAAQVGGVSGGVDGDRCPIGLNALSALGVPDGAEPIETVPSYDWQYPAILQEESFDCSETSVLWGLRAWGRETSDDWLESQMMAEGVMTEEYGLMDASGAQLAEFLNRHYAELGYWAESADPVSFDQLAEEAATYQHPLASGGRAWAHWTAVRGFDQANDVLLLANPAPGYPGGSGPQQTMTRAQFAQLGPFSLVRLTHPAAEEGGDVDDPYAPWIEGGRVGSGLIDMMRADNTLPAQRASTWLPLGTPPPSDIEECVGQNGVHYYWLLTTNQGFRISPD